MSLPRGLWVLLAAAALIAAGGYCAHGLAAQAPSGPLRTMVEADWDAQEKRLGRQAGSSESIRAALARGGRLVAALKAMPNGRTPARRPPTWPGSAKRPPPSPLPTWIWRFTATSAGPSGRPPSTTRFSPANPSPS